MRLFAVCLFLFSLSVLSYGRPETYKYGYTLKNNNIPPSCESRIYCQGDLLHTVQMYSIFNDSKTFVDMHMLDDEANILQKFEIIMKESNGHPSRHEVSKFVSENFASTNELENWTPEDFTSNPPILQQICSEDIRSFAKNVINIWPDLGRKISKETLKNIHRHSLLPLTNGFIIPGGRFKENYYWDSYWIMKGLLISGMPKTVHAMLDNFVTLIKHHGFIPNGARVYYTQRSQPPLFAAMVHEYYKTTGDNNWLEANIKYVDQEVTFWLSNRLVRILYQGEEYNLARYYPESLGPRPESYREDFQTASMLRNEKDKQKIYTNLKGGAESGWDFTSRWFYDSNGGNNGNLSSIDTGRTIPADLNSFLYKSCQLLSIMYSTLGKLDEAQKWLHKAIEFKNAIHKVLFNEEDGIWYDFDMKLKRHRREFFVSNLAPLWVEATHDTFDAKKLIQKLYDQKIFEYQGGTPSSLKRTGEQWDHPNAWPPLQAIFVQALANTNVPEGKAIAEKLAKQWVTANIIGYEKTGYMFEKYDAIEPGLNGGGGEYEVQAGFGWTNGVVLEFIRDYYTNCA